MPAQQNRSINELIEVTSHGDKDHRYMALSDIDKQLQRDDVRINSQEEVRVVDAILKSLTDPVNDVKTAAVKCVAGLAKKVKSSLIAGICKKLCELIRSSEKDNAKLRDVYRIALKKLIEDIPVAMGQEISKSVSDELVIGIKKDQLDAAVKRECLIILEQLLKRFGTSVASKHESIIEDVLLCCMNFIQVQVDLTG